MEKALVQIFLPLADNDGQHFSGDWYAAISRKLNDQFGGVTLYRHTPVTGLWKEEENNTIKDQLIIYEVMADNIDLVFWELFKQELERQFRQESVLIRAYPIQVM